MTQVDKYRITFNTEVEKNQILSIISNFEDTHGYFDNKNQFVFYAHHSDTQSILTKIKKEFENIEITELNFS